MSKKCPSCDKTVYSMEATKAGGDAYWFHKVGVLLVFSFCFLFALFVSLFLLIDQ